jgi:hypothetical protein
MKFQEKKSNGNAHFSEVKHALLLQNDMKSNGNAHFLEVKHALLLQNDIVYKQWFKNKVKYK